MHFSMLAEIQNLTNRYILLPIRDNLAVISGGTMAELHMYLFDDKPLVEANDEGADVLLIILNDKDEANQAGSNTELVA